MGGASSYYAMLSICGFLSATWIASKFSRLLGVSSIVLEISTGVVFGPQVAGLIVDEYATCEHARHAECEPPANVLQLAQGGHDLGKHLSKFNNADKCDIHLFLDDHHAAPAATTLSHSEGLGHSDNMGSPGHGSTAASAVSPGASHHVVAQGSDGGRRLSGGGGGGTEYASFAECLEKQCESEVSHHCGLTPDVFTLIGHAGVALMIFESGMHFDFEKAKTVGIPACCVAVLGTILPLIVGTVLLVAFGFPMMPHGVSAGTALAPTSVGIALRLLGEAGVLQQDFGQAIITAAFVDDILSLVLFNVLFSLGGDFDLFKTVLAPIIGIAFMLGAMVAAVKFWPKAIDEMIMPRVPERRDESATGLRRMRLEKDEALFLGQIIMLVAYSMITHLLGTHLWGCFIAGMSFACLQPPHHAHHVWVKQTKRMTSWMIRIFFSCTVAFSIPVLKLLSFPAFWKGSIMGIFACIMTKVCCAFFMGKPRWVIGWAMVGRAEFAYLIAQMALSGNMLDEESFSIVIWALLYATVFAPFVFRLLLNRYIKETGMETTSGDADALKDEAHTDEAHGHTQAKAAKLDLASAPAQGLHPNDIDLECVKQGNNKQLAKLDGEESAEHAVQPRGRPAAGRSGLATGKEGNGNGFLCCLFFKKIIVQ
mmetsp:Transcript_61185/g.189526  ORF Transcript_61185/g.189526 Transcript_61185/m.189526 type:complete len:652 (-) Transcript_61185:137-2092(-)